MSSSILPAIAPQCLSQVLYRILLRGGQSSCLLCGPLPMVSFVSELRILRFQQYILSSLTRELRTIFVVFTAQYGEFPLQHVGSGANLF